MAAVEIARDDPPQIVRGDLNEEIAALVARVPASATPVIFHTAVLAYLDRLSREHFAERVSSLPGHWISNEGGRVTPGVADRLANPRPESGEFLLALDGRPVAVTHPHGRYVEWLTNVGNIREANVVT